jgi:hypothetical protein
MKLEASRQILEKCSQITCHANSSRGSRVILQGRTDGHDEANSRFSQFCEHALTTTKFIHRMNVPATNTVWELVSIHQNTFAPLTIPCSRPFLSSGGDGAVPARNRTPVVRPVAQYLHYNISAPHSKHVSYNIFVTCSIYLLPHTISLVYRLKWFVCCRHKT